VRVNIDDFCDRTNDEGDIPRLQRRIGELESVIREVRQQYTLRTSKLITSEKLKNKPHPRWASSLERNTADMSDADSQMIPRKSGNGRPTVSEHSNISFPPIRTTFPPSPTPTVGSTTGSNSPSICNTPPTGLSGGNGMRHGLDQELLAILGALNQAPIGDQSSSLTHPTKSNVCRGPHGAQLDMCVCPCIMEPPSYHALLELSLRLRRAADIISLSAHHLGGTSCFLLQRIIEVDTLIRSVARQMSAMMQLKHTLAKHWETYTRCQRFLVRLARAGSVRQTLGTAFHRHSTHHACQAPHVREHSQQALVRNIRVWCPVVPQI
jgi:hypothetical protein